MKFWFSPPKLWIDCCNEILKLTLPMVTGAFGPLWFVYSAWPCYVGVSYQQSIASAILKVTERFLLDKCAKLFWSRELNLRFYIWTDCWSEVSLYCLVIWSLNKPDTSSTLSSSYMVPWVMFWAFKFLLIFFLYGIWFGWFYLLWLSALVNYLVFSKSRGLRFFYNNKSVICCCKCWSSLK